MALNEQMQQMIQQDIQDAETRPKEEILKEQMEGLKTVGRTARDIAVESIPGVSESLAEKRIDEAMQRGDTTGAMIEGAAGLMGAVPMVGDAAAKGLRAVAAPLKKTRKAYKDEVKEVPAVKLEKFEPAKVAQINKTWWLDGDTVTLYHGTNKRNLADISAKGLQPDAEGFVYLTPDPNTAAGYASMSGSGGEKAFRKSGKAKNTPEEERVILKYEIPKEEFLKYLDMTKQRHNPSSPSYKAEQDKLFNKDLFNKHIKDKKKEDYYATTEVRFPDSGVFDNYLTAVSNRKNALKSDEIQMAKGGTVMDDYLLAKITDEPQSFAKGGIAKQMELFEPVERGFDEGGLMEEGGMVDEESGNEVPPGSLREEVRDDIPAQLSEGEFVFPADVVRYIGLEKLMRMRQEAKQGLAQMEAMGQMGNGDEAVVEDNLPFDMYDLDVEDEEEYNSETRNYQVGGYVAPNIPYNQPNQVNPQTGVFQLPGTGISGYQMPPGGTPTGYTPYSGVQPYFQPVQFTGPQFQTSLQTTNLPTFAETVGNKPGQYDELRTYVNDAGQIRQIPFKNGQPIYPIPEGFRPKEEEATTPTVEPTTGTGRQTGGDDNGRDGLDVTTTTTGTAKVPSFLEGIFGKTEQPAGSKSDAFFNVTPTDKFTGSNYGIEGFSLKDGFDVKSEALAKASATQGMYQMALIGPSGVGSALAKEFGLMDYNMKDMAVAGQTAKTAALNAIGYNDTMQLSSVQQADLVGKAMTAAHEAAKAGKNVEEAINSVLNTKEATAAKVEALNNLRDQLVPSGGSYKDLAEIANQLTETYKAQRDNLLAGGFDNELGGKGVVTDRTGKAVQGRDGPVLTGAGKQLKDTLDAKIGRTSAAGSLAGSDFAGSAEAYNENVRAGTDFATSFGAFRGSSEDDDNDSGSSNDGPSNDNSSNESGSGGGMGGGYGSEDDGWGGGD